MRRGHINQETTLMCEACGKVILPTKKRALIVANKQKLRFYECPRGNGYHLGHWRVFNEDKIPVPSTVFKGSIEELQELAQKMRA